MSVFTKMPSDDGFFHEIWLKHHTKIHSYAVNLCGNIPDADDLTQNFYLQVLTNEKTIRQGYQEKKLNYLLSMMKNYKKTEWKRLQNYQRKLNELRRTIPRDTGGPHTSLKECMDAHYDDLEKILCDQDFKIIKMYAAGYSHKEIAVTFPAMSPNNVAVRICRIKKKIRNFCL